MTASTSTGTRGSSTFPVAGPLMGGALGCSVGSYTFASGDDEVGDVFKMCKVPAGATVVGGYVQGADLDTGTETLDIDVGWLANGSEAIDADGFGNLGVWDGDAVSQIKPETGIYYPLQGVLRSTGPQTFTNTTTITLTVNAAANTLGGGKITVVVFWTYL